MRRFTHTDSCEYPDGERIYFFLEIYPNHEHDTITFGTGEQCGWCHQAIQYAGDVVPSWQVTRGFISRVHTWWTTFAHRNNLWETAEVAEDRDPPF